MNKPSNIEELKIWLLEQMDKHENLSKKQFNVGAHDDENFWDSYKQFGMFEAYEQVLAILTTWI